MNLIITMDDALAVNYCAKGTRRFFIEHGLDFADFLKNGIESDVFLEKTKHDAMVVALVEAVRNGRK